MARIVTRLVAACYTMRQYAVEAGLLDRYLVSVARQVTMETNNLNNSFLIMITIGFI